MRRPHYDQVTPTGILFSGLLGIAIGAIGALPAVQTANEIDVETARRIERERVAAGMQVKELGRGYWRR